MRVDPGTMRRPEPERWWVHLLRIVGAVVAAAFRPIGTMARSDRPLDAFGLVQLSGSAGDALVTIALAGSIFFEVPVDEATVKVAAYLLLTMAPLALAAPVLVPLLDRAGPRRIISFAASAGRALLCLYGAPRISTLVLFPVAFLLLALTKVHAITRNGLVLAYAGPDEGLVRANARLGRIAAGGVILGSIPGVLVFQLGDAAAVLYLGAVAYAISAALNLRLPHPGVRKGEAREVGRLGHVPELAAPAIGAAGLRAASGFLLFTLAFALRRSGEPAWWFGLLAAVATAGGLAGDLLAPRLPENLREEAVVIGCIAGAGVGAMLAFAAFSLPVLVLFALVVGTAAELGRLAFQSMMQRLAPEGAHGRVFVRYEVLFQLAWVGGALIPALTELGFREAFLVLAVLYLVAGIGYLAPDLLARRRSRG
ncbi:MAG TPA: hypothetical protein VFR44_13675 [Actinomycetota bacterium]|nr:hypothetical protein [Actinomycetota bacterium]